MGNSESSEKGRFPLKSLYTEKEFMRVDEKPPVYGTSMPTVDREDIARLFWARTEEAILKKGIKKSDIAHKLRVRPDVLSRWIQKNTFPKAEQIVIIARALNLTVEYLVTGITPDNELSDIRRKFQQFIDESSDEDLQKLWDFMAVMRGRK